MPLVSRWVISGPFVALVSAWAGAGAAAAPAGNDDTDATVSRFVSKAIGVLGDRYGGVWLVGSVLSVGVVHEAPADVAQLASFAPPGLVLNVVDVKYSQDQLTGFVDLATGMLANLPEGIIMIAPRTELNKIEVVTNRSVPGLQAALESVLPVDAFVITEQPGFRLRGARST